VLLDFGAARITLSEEAMKLKPMYTAGFAAPEHYRFKPEELGRGATSTRWAPRCTLHRGHAAAGRRPARGEGQDDPGEEPRAPGYSDDLYDIVDSCLQLDWLKRPQTAFDLQKRLREAARRRARTAAQQHLRHHQQAAVEALLAQGRTEPMRFTIFQDSKVGDRAATRTASATRTARTCC
jgi:hypothetical protein